MFSKVDASIPTSTKIIGIGGGGCKSVEKMMDFSPDNVELCVLDSDFQIDQSKVRGKICIQDFKDIIPFGSSEEWFNRWYATSRNANLVKSFLGATENVVFVTGLGGTMGTFCIKWLVKMLSQLNIKIYVVCTIPFDFEGDKRRNLALEAIQFLSTENINVTKLNSDNLKRLYPNLQLTDCFSHLDGYVSRIVIDICKRI